MGDDGRLLRRDILRIGTDLDGGAALVRQAGPLPRLLELAIGRADQRLILLVEIHVLLQRALELGPVEQHIGFGGRPRAGQRDIDQVAEHAHPVKLLKEFAESRASSRCCRSTPR